MSTNPSATSQNRQAGMVAIMVTLILMIVISLIVLGFAQISRRNQRQALDRQLSTQAFYAAETGVNDAAKLLNDTPAGTAIPPKPDCASTGGGFYSSLLTSAVIDAAANVEYTCLIVDPSPPSLVYSNIGARGTVIPITAASGTIDRLTLTWQSKDASSTPANNCPSTAASVFSTAASWNCGYGVLRFDLVPTSGTHTISSLQAATMSTHVVPLRPASTGTAQPVAYATGGASNRVSTVCSNTNCSLTISFAAPQSQYYMRLMSLYKDVSMQITASSGGTAVNLTGTQALVDVTGKAEDVLRRIQVRLPLAGSSTNQLSDYGLATSRPVCKRFSVMDGFFLSDAENVVPGVSAVTPNPLCD